MNRRTSLGQRGWAALASLFIISGANTALSQQAVTTPTPPPGAAESSTEQGHTQMDDSFDFREWRLEKRRKAWEDTTFELNIRTFFLDRNKFDGTEQEAWAIGGWAGLKTGYFLDHIAFGLTGYTSQPVYAPDSRDGTLLLETGQEGYTVLGEAYAEIRIADGYIISVGRKGFDTPYINRNDSRMTPNTFEAIVFQGRTELGNSSPDTDVNVTKDGTALSKESKDVVAPAPAPKKEVAVLKYGLGYFDEIKERNSSSFVSMSRDAGADVERGVWAAGLLYEKGKFSIGGIDYYSDDIINIAYVETKMELPISAGFRPKLHAQFTDQRSVGDNLLQGQDFSGDQFGIKAELPVGKALFTAGFTHTLSGANMQNPWSGYPGYTSVQVQDFNRAGENAFLLRAGYEFTTIPGLSTYALAVFGTTPDAVGQYRQDEYDVNLQWAPPKGCLKGFSVRLRYALVDQHGGNVENLTDFRTIVNYVIKF
ncbi:MAG: OprD family outer membrane porin [Chthoniobacterales bacterium]